LRKYNIEEEKVLILISSLMIWNRTPPKMREVKEGCGFVNEGGENAEGEQPPAEGVIPEISLDDIKDGAEGEVPK